MGQLIEFNFKEENTSSLIFVPGYSRGFDEPVLKSLISHYKDKNFDVLGLDLPYKEDVIDSFQNSQELLTREIVYFKSRYPAKNIFVVAKSLGGSLALYNLANLPIAGLVILGCSIILGWPQRLSLLSKENPMIPDYRKEWGLIFEKVTIPVRIISGEEDDLSDNVFLQEVARKNKFVKLALIKNANHNLIDSKSDHIFISECVDEINQLL